MTQAGAPAVYSGTRRVGSRAAAEGSTWPWRPAGWRGGEALRYHDLLRNLLARDLKVRYKHSRWASLVAAPPVMVIAVLVFVFRVLLETTIPHFGLFIVVGYPLWSYGADALSACAVA